MTQLARRLLAGCMAALTSGLLVVFPGARLAAAETGLVQLAEVAPGIRQDIRYASARNFMARPLPGYRAEKCLLRRPVALALRAVQTYLARRDPPLGLKVFDCYRPMRAVKAMARWTRSGPSEPGDAFYFPAHTKSELIARGYISAQSSHARGISVDLTLVRLANGARPESGAPQPGTEQRPSSCKAGGGAREDPAEVDMGTSFDCFDPASWTRSAGLSATQRGNRRRLVEVMGRFGFRNYHREWWHFTFNSAGAAPALDRAID